MANFGNDVTIIPAGTVITATGQSAAYEPDNKATLRAVLVITAASGTTPSITITMQTSYDAGVTDSWRTVGSAFPAQTTTGTVRQTFSGVDRYVRASYVVSGTTPSFTLGLTGEMV